MQHPDLVPSLGTTVADQGFVWLKTPMITEDFAKLTESFGAIVDTTMVRVDRSIPTYLCGHGAVPFHTDHAYVDLVAWFCVEQDDYDGACLLVDGRQVVQELPPEDVAALRDVRLRHRGAAEPKPILSKDGSIFFAPWLLPESATETSSPFEAFRDAVARQHAVEVHLQPGEIVFIDNRRVLHGRRAISPTSKRQLIRRWIRSGALRSSSAAE